MVTRRRGLARRRNATGTGRVLDLTLEQRQNLLFGGRERAFANDKDRRAAWDAVKDNWRGHWGYMNFKRPAAWWEYENTARRLWPCEDDENFLARTGQLVGDEERELKRMRADGYLPPELITWRPKDPYFRARKESLETHEEFLERIEANRPGRRTPKRARTSASSSIHLEDCNHGR